MQARGETPTQIASVLLYGKAAPNRKYATSGHSLRAGFITSAARAGVPEWKIRARSRHKSAEQVASYIRAAEEWTDSGLKGLGF